MEAFFDAHPQLAGVAAVAAAFALLAALAAGLPRIGGRFTASLLPRSKWLPACAAACVVGAIVIGLRAGEDPGVGRRILLLGGAGVFLTVVWFAQDAVDRASRLGLELTPGADGDVYRADMDGASVRVRPQEGRAYPDGSDVAMDVVEIDVPALDLGAAKASARWPSAQERFLPRFLTQSLDGLFSGAGVHWRDQRAAAGPPRWPGWQFWGAPPASAAELFGRVAPPKRWGGGRLRAFVIGVRDGRVRFHLEGDARDEKEMRSAVKTAREFVAALVAGGPPPSLLKGGGA